MLDSGDDDIAGDIRRALEGDSEPQAEKVEVAAEAEIPVEIVEEEPEKADDGRVRGADGKFIAKQAETVQDTTEQQPETGTPQESIRPPASWSAAAKAKFATLDPDVQKEVLKREQDVEKGFRDRANELKRYQPLEDVLAPRRALWAAQGLDETQAIKTLLAAQDLLEQDPRKGLEFLAKSYGVSLAQPQGQAPEPQPQGNSPQYEQLLAKFSQLEQRLQEAQSAPVVSQVESFFADPKNLYAENVRSDMAVLLREGRAKDLPEAYEMACWMRPDIRPLLQTPQVAKVQDNVAKAKAAAVSVTGSPANARGASNNATGSIEDDIRKAYEELSGQA